MSLVAFSPGTVTLTLRDADQTQQLVLSVGVPGPAGPAGANGAAGVGVPAGGLEGQVLVKATDVSYDTAWVDNYALQVRAQVRNETGATLAKGTVVYINGGAGNKVTVTKAIATGDATSAQTLGVIIADILTNQNGYVCVLGLLTGLNTLGYTEGQQLYLSPTTAGAFTTTKPSAPDHMVYVAIVERIHANQGTILVRVQNGFEVAELHDAAISSPQDGDLFVYEHATALWKNKSLATLDIVTFVDLAGYATQSWVTSQGYLTDAPSNGYGYTRKNGAWSYTPKFYSVQVGEWTNITSGQYLVNDGSFVTNITAGDIILSDIAGLGIRLTNTGILFPDATTQTTAGISSATASSTYYPLSNPAGYLDQTTADGLYYSVSNPSGYIDASAISDMATMTWVNGQGFLTSVPNPSADFMMANAIASLIYIQSTNSYGDLLSGNAPQFLTALGTNWGIVDGSATYYNCTGFSGSSYGLSGTAGSGPYTVRVNGTDSAFTF